MNILILVLDNVFDTGLSTVLDTFTTANELAAITALCAPPFYVQLVGIREQARTAQGLQVSLKRWQDCAMPDWVLVPAIGYKMPDPLLQALSHSDMREVTSTLVSLVESGTQMAAACIGTFVLAEAGLLDGHDATTTWWLSPLFRQRYPKVRLDESRMVVQSGKRLTAGAALGHIDMALSIVRQVSPELAALTAKYLIVDSRPAQSAYVISEHLNHNDPLVARFERMVRERLATGFSLEHIARELATSKRTLARRIHDVLGKTPLSYVQDLRVEQAVHRLKTSNDSIEQIATQVGYADGVTLRTLLRRKLGRGLRELRTN